MPSNLYLFAYTIVKLSITTGFVPALLAIGVWEFICRRAELRAERREAVVIPFPDRRAIAVHAAMRKVL